MSNSEELPQISDGARVLLRIARERDKHRAMAQNLALILSLNFSEDLLQVCFAHGTDLASLLGSKFPLQNFLQISAASINAIREQIDCTYGLNRRKLAELPQLPRARFKLHTLQGILEKRPDGKVLVMSDFNRHVLQAFAETLADVTWPDREVQDGDDQDFEGPATDLFVSRMARHNLETIWLTMIQNYLGNILQDYFVGLRVRDRNRNLDPSTELSLRRDDALTLARQVMQSGTDPKSLREPESIVIACLNTTDRLDSVIDKAVA